MTSWMKIATLLALCGSLTACGSGNTGEQPINTDYSALRVAPSHEGALGYATNDEQLLQAVRNGLRMSLGGASAGGAVTDIAGPAGQQGTFSATTVQVDGVDEADLVKYDGQYIYTMRLHADPSIPGITSHVLTIARTEPATAGTQVVSEFNVDGEQTLLPQLYSVQSAEGATEYLAAVSHDYRGWIDGPAVTSLVLKPDHTRIQLLDVRDPANVSQAWDIKMDGWLRASRKIDDTLYLISSYRPRLAGLQLPADTQERKRANELRIRNASPQDLLPGYQENGGVRRALIAPADCLLPADLAVNDAYSDLLVITALSLSQRRVVDVNCVSTNLNGVYLSRDSLYVGGQDASVPAATSTSLHKFALDGGDISYRASGMVSGSVGWQNAAHFMDEHDGDLRVVTSRFIFDSPTSGDFVHRLHVLREANHELSVIATLPSSQRTAPIGKPGEQVHAVRFFGKRAYVVTARVTDPLYVLDLSVPEDPFIAGTLEIPGVSTYLQPLGAAGAEAVLAVGAQVDEMGLRTAVKVELFDVRDITQPRSIASQVFGDRGTSSEALSDPHALTVYSRTADRVRIALPIDVFARTGNDVPKALGWIYSGSHLFEVHGLEDGVPQLDFKGVIKTAESDGSNPLAFPPRVTPQRAVMHDDAVFVVDGAKFIGSLWGSIAPL